MQNESLERLNHALRTNNDARISYMGKPLESMLRTAADRYTDPLIHHKLHDVCDPYARERVAAEDPIAHVLTWGYGDRAWSEMVKFYDSDQLEAMEIGQNTRLMLKSIKFDRFMSVVMALTGTHGWCCGRWWIENGEFKYRIYSEQQVKPERFMRNEQNEVLGVDVYNRPRLPLNRNQVNIQPFFDTLMVGDPGAFFVVRGDKVSSFGFGYSRLEPVWDAICKIREESHANAFRSRVFPIAVVPPKWTPDQIDEFFQKVANMDQDNALVTKAGTDAQGNPMPELPNMSWVTPGQSAANKSTSGSTAGAGSFASLSSEWVRLCAATRHSIRYFTGNPGGALAAADVDAQQDLQSDIEEFKLYTDIITTFLNWLGMNGVPIDVPPGFVVKSHWEWERDEALLAQAEMQMYEMQQQSQSQNNTPKQNQRWIENANPDPWKGGAYHQAYSRAPMALKRGRQLEQQRFMQQLQKSAGQLTGGNMIPGMGEYSDMDGGDAPGEEQPSDAPNNGIVPGQWIPITGSESGKWKRVKLGLDGKNVVAETSEGRQYHYDDLPQAEQYVGAIRDQGGHAIWELLRAPKATRDLYPEGKAPMGFAKTGTGFYPYAGAAHYQPEYELGDPDQGQPISKATIQGKTSSFSEVAEQTPLSLELPSRIPQTFSELATREPLQASPQAMEPAAGMTPSTLAKATTMRDKAAGRAEENKQRDHEKGVAAQELMTKQQQKKASDESINPSSMFGEMLTKSSHVSLRLLGRAFKIFGSRSNESFGDASRKRFNEMSAELVNHTFGNQQIDYIKTLLEYERDPKTNTPRFNAVAYGNGMAFNQPLYYPAPNGGFFEEFACKKDWKKLVGQKGPLDMFHMNQKYNIGTYEIVGWDDQADLPIDRISYDEEKVKNACMAAGLDQSRVIDKLTRGLVPDVSTEYYCDIKIHNNKRFQTNFREISASFVEFGNCPDNQCVFTRAD